MAATGWRGPPLFFVLDAEPDAAIRELELALVARAEEHGDAPMPAFTHLQLAQPVADRNPDAMELARGKAGPMMGDLMALLATLKGTLSGYTKDLQGDKARLFHALDTLAAVLPAVAGTIRTLRNRLTR